MLWKPPKCWYFPSAFNCIDSKQRKDFINTTEKVHIIQPKRNSNYFSFSKELHMNDMEIIWSNYIIFETWSNFQLLSRLSSRHGKCIWHILGHRELPLADLTHKACAVYWKRWMNGFICWIPIGYKIRLGHMYFNRFRIHLIRKHFKSQINLYF